MEITKTWSSLIVDGQVPRETILKIEEELRADNVPGVEICDHNVEMPVNHHFAPGLYAREFNMRKGYVVVGKIHKHEHLSYLAKGSCSVLTEKGVEHLKAPLMFTSFPGAKRVVFAHEDLTWITFHPTDETDLDKIEDYVIAKSFDEFDKFLTDIGDEEEGSEI